PAARAHRGAGGGRALRPVRRAAGRGPRQLHRLDMVDDRRAGRDLPAAAHPPAGGELHARLRRSMMRAPWILAAAPGACPASAPPSPPPAAPTSPGAGGLAAPTVNAPPTTSAESAPVRGNGQGASMVVVQTCGATNAVGLVLPDGTFCVDVPLAAGD